MYPTLSDMVWSLDSFRTRTQSLGLALVWLVLLFAGSGRLSAQSVNELEAAAMLANLSPQERAELEEALSRQSGGDERERSVSVPTLVTPRDPFAENDVQEMEENSSNEEILPFGYSLFAGNPTTFAPATDIPLPAEYIVGPGDTLQVQLIGTENRTFTLVVDREGNIPFPEIGPITVAGMRFAEVRERIQSQVEEQLIGVTSTVTAGPLRSIRVFVLGDVYQPGSYTVSALTTITHALVVSGGIDSIGSLRRVQLKRQGETITELDLYDLLLQGDTSNDLRLEPGDVVFVPPVGSTVTIRGEVNRPAIYELKGSATVGQAVSVAGGERPTAFLPKTQIERISEGGERIVVDVDLSSARGRDFALRSGDVVTLLPALDSYSNAVELRGHVKRAGPKAWSEGMRVSDLVGGFDALLPQADLGYALIRRERMPDREIEVLAVDLRSALNSVGGQADLTLQSFDRLHVFPRSGDEERQEVVDALIEEVTTQADSTRPRQVISVQGRVHAPGEYPMFSGMRISDALRAGGGLLDSAFLLGAEISRYEISQESGLSLAYLDVDLESVLSGDPASDFELAPYDRLMVKTLPEWFERSTVNVEGEVRFPGTYTIRRGENLRDVIERAGGLTELAYPEGIVFLRERLKAKEADMIAQLLERLRSDLAVLTIQESRTERGLGVEGAQLLDSLISDLESSEPTGRLVLDFVAMLNDPATMPLALEASDQILIPQRPSEVTVVGEVQFPTSHLFQAGRDRFDYIDASGGLTYKADKRRIFVVRASGEVSPLDRGTVWFRNRSTPLDPGDTVVVPIKVDRLPSLTYWTSVTQIIYNLAIAAAAVNSF